MVRHTNECPHMTEDKAIRLCLKHQDPLGFEFLVRQYQREAFFHSYAILQNESDAADACQEAFTRAFKAMPGLEQLDRFYPWFYRILRNCSLNILARRKTRQNYASSHQQEIEAIDVASASPADILSSKEGAGEVWLTLCELSKTHRTILTLKYINGFSYEAISTTLSIPRGTVMSRLYAARKAFRELHNQQISKQ